MESGALPYFHGGFPWDFMGFICLPGHSAMDHMRDGRKDAPRDSPWTPWDAKIGNATGRC